MLISILRSIRVRRAAARTYRVLSALDDDALCDVGLDRRTLRAFCDAGCSHPAAPGIRTSRALVVMQSAMLRPNLG
ncbi:hypothetical protein MBRA_05777 [Methylobacterium brachiatum]|nr:hypothetical protein MBRA_05777 [Methylobacterium brachiatum]